ncbi:MAG: hypothetical protein OXD47_11000 [Gammaproteobacteria bacterium]|nr:hypothetical protein [Gammaproteobacteria bacterium]MCY4210391.1 hypothetical protein [Gammaproteobacteria bacterium]MCY4282621.1 hypothetical protein [Gammaproteobacteria bacterium]MCY4339304.1 hypothetical protein [Gammaproteobacteria bacterium]
MISLYGLLIFVAIIGVVVAGQYSSHAAEQAPGGGTVPYTLALDTDDSDAQPLGETATLRVPATRQEQRQDEQCMTVCSNWGEECVMFNAGSDRALRKCVRTCKAFSEECL